MWVNSWAQGRSGRKNVFEMLLTHPSPRGHVKTGRARKRREYFSLCKKECMFVPRKQDTTTAHKIHTHTKGHAEWGGGLTAVSQPAMMPGVSLVHQGPRDIRHHVGKTIPRSLNFHLHWPVYLQRHQGFP